MWNINKVRLYCNFFTNLFTICVVLKVACISRRSAAKNLSVEEILYTFAGKFIPLQAVNKLWKSFNIWQIYKL